MFQNSLPLALNYAGNSMCSGSEALTSGKFNQDLLTTANFDMVQVKSVHGTELQYILALHLERWWYSITGKKGTGSARSICLRHTRHEWMNTSLNFNLDSGMQLRHVKEAGLVLSSRATQWPHLVMDWWWSTKFNFLSQVLKIVAKNK